MKYIILITLLLCLYITSVLSACGTCTSGWCSTCGTCTSGAVGATCCAHDDCSGDNCCDYCTKKCTSTVANCDARTCTSSSATATTKTASASSSTTKTASTSTTKAASSSTTGSSSGGTTMTGVYITSYGWNDNDDGSNSYGNDIIAYTSVRHGHAVETSGTYADPCTFATESKFLAPGTIIYVPSVKKYYIMEDGCVECTDDWNKGKKHVDLWIGPNSATIPEGPLANCEGSITTDAGTIIVNPPSNLAVTTTKIFINGVCTH